MLANGYEANGHFCILRHIDCKKIHSRVNQSSNCRIFRSHRPLSSVWKTAMNPCAFMDGT